LRYLILCQVALMKQGRKRVEEGQFLDPFAELVSDICIVFQGAINC